MSAEVRRTQVLTQQPDIHTQGGDQRKVWPDVAESQLEFWPVGYAPGTRAASRDSGWCLRIDVLTADPMISFWLDVGGEVILGRGDQTTCFVDLRPYDADRLGVSRDHLKLYPDRGSLWVVDRRSKYGTRQNGELIDVDTPSCLTDGDVLQLGMLKLQFVVVSYPKDRPINVFPQESPTETTLRQQLATLRAALGMLSQPLMIVNDRGQIVVSNRAAEELWKYVLGEETGGSEASQTFKLSALLDSLTQAVGRTSEIHVGDRIYVVTVEHTPDRGTLIVMQEATAVWNIERLRIEFAQALSHDMRGPLSSIIGFAQFLSDAAITDDERKEYLSEIFQASDHLTEMASHLLDFALLGLPTQSAMTDCNLSDAVSDAISDLKGVALSKTVQIDFSRSGEAFPIRGEIVRLYRSVLNLVENAIKYSPNGSRVDITLEYTSKEIVLVVRDDGPGIPEDELEHIFEKYYRVKQPIKRRTGIGMGLAMVHTTIKAHGGQVIARNRPGGGSEFVITLPGTLRSDTTASP